MKNVVKLEQYYCPWKLEKAIEEWVHHYNHGQYHESLDNVIPDDYLSAAGNQLVIIVNPWGVALTICPSLKVTVSGEAVKL